MIARYLGQSILLASFALLAAACSVDETSAPPLAGPSTFALNVVMSATPDNITQDGASQSSIVIDAKGPDGRPARYVPFRLEMWVPDPASPGALVAADFGRLSTKQPSTNDVGQAIITYTSPPRPTESTGTGVVVTIVATPVGSDYGSQYERKVDIRVIPPGVLVPPNRVVADFEFSPATPATFTPVSFNATKTASDGVPCGTACAYEWSFGDGGGGTGMLPSHEFRSLGTFQVTLTATNGRGQSGTVTKPVTVGAGQLPTAAFTSSPTAPLPGQAVFFNAAASTAASGRRLVRYDWDFGSGRTGEGVAVSKTYDTAGAYTVTLKVTDDAGQSATVTQTVTVGGGSAVLPTASFIFSPTNPQPGDQIFFNATASTAGPGRALVSYRWDFGSGREGSGATISKGYDTAGSYAVTLTVTDDAGQIGSVTQTVSVGGGSVTPPTAAFVYSPTTPSPGQTIFFDASTSTPGAGRQLASFQWNFGDGTTGTGRTPTKQFVAAGSYVVSLVVTDDQGRSGTTSQTIQVGSPPPTAVFTASPNNVQAPRTINFNATASRAGTGRTIASYRWEFGDGAGAGPGPALSTTSHLYSSPGTYVVTLTVTDDLGVATTVTQQVTLTP